MVNKKRKTVFIDLETTGFSRKNDRIIEVGIIIENKEYHTLLNPKKQIPNHIQNLTGITTYDVKNSPTFKEIAVELYDLLNNSLLIGHNILFDYQFLQHEFSCCGYDFRCSTLDTLKMARKLYPNLPNHKLDTLSSHLNIILPKNQRHTALGDTYATKSAYKKMLLTDPKLINLITPKSPLPLKEVENLPEKSGIYTFWDKKNACLYVGKAKNIKKRVKEHLSKAQSFTYKISKVKIFHSFENDLKKNELMYIERLKPMYNVLNNK